MTFWSKEKLEVEQEGRQLISPFLTSHIEGNAYALGVAPEYAITSEVDGGEKRILAAGMHVTIPPGKFAILLTEEEVQVPLNAMAFISMKARFKFRGLINVSGFHVDPGFTGKLKFAVYNSGVTAIDLTPGQRVFLIWYCTLDQPTSASYTGMSQNQEGITAEDVMMVRGITISPAGLKSRVDRLDESVKAELKRLEAKIDNHQTWVRTIIGATALAFVVWVVSLFKPIVETYASRGRDNAWTAPSNSASVKRNR